MKQLILTGLVLCFLTACAASPSGGTSATPARCVDAASQHLQPLAWHEIDEYDALADSGASTRSPSKPWLMTSAQPATARKETQVASVTALQTGKDRDCLASSADAEPYPAEGIHEPASRVAIARGCAPVHSGLASAGHYVAQCPDGHAVIKCEGDVCNYLRMLE